MLVIRTVLSPHHGNPCMLLHLQFAPASGIVDVHLCNLPMCMEDPFFALKASRALFFLQIDNQPLIDSSHTLFSRQTG